MHEPPLEHRTPNPDVGWSHVDRRGLIIASPRTGSGKTILTLGLHAALRGRCIPTSALKVGPDFIDPAFHSAVVGSACSNVDLWAMRNGTLDDVLRDAVQEKLALVEGVMGLFDGEHLCASTADFSTKTGWPILLLVDASGLGESVAAIVRGLLTWRREMTFAGIILNRVNTERHAELLKRAIRPLGLPLFGVLPSCRELLLPSRHLGLQQACETKNLHRIAQFAAKLIEKHIRLDSLISTASSLRVPAVTEISAPLPPLGSRIAVARDAAFSFCYPTTLRGWQKEGVEISFFSPLADESPPSNGSVFLPGGYPELHAEQLSHCRNFMSGLRRVARSGALAVYGECGGYMVLGETLTDKNAKTYNMAGLLSHRTSFAERKRSLGYREVRLRTDFLSLRKGERLRGHVFHYSTLGAQKEEALFNSNDAYGNQLCPTGGFRGNVFGSFVHLVDRV